jgi:hypothetical protein
MIHHPHVVEIFLPLKTKDGAPQPRELYAQVRDELVGRFGGLTAFTRAPAEGLWEPQPGEREQDEMVIFEVLADRIDRDRWREYRLKLQQRFGQDEILIRAHPVETL